MQGLQRGVVTAVLLAWCVTSTADQKFRASSFGYSEPSPPSHAVIAERSSKHLSLYGDLGLSLGNNEISVPGASFVKLHLSQFSLPTGVTLEISNPDKSEVWRYSNKEKDAFTVDSEIGDDGANSFSAMSITGDHVLVELVGKLYLLDPFRHAVMIDSYMEGLPLGQSKVNESAFNKFAKDGKSEIENACGADERYDAACWASSNSWEYNRSAAVAKLITSRGEVCTAWRVGPDNHLFTAEHCLGSQSELSGAEIWFNYEAASCGSSQNSAAVKVAGGSLLARNQKLDYALFTVSSFSSVSSFPFFGLQTSSADIGEPIFIPQHGLGRPRQIALESDMNSSGECEVDALDLDGYSPGSDIGYYCDTTTSSSGAPVVSNVSGRVLAIHHFGGCMNAGVSIKDIWPEVSSFFSGQVPGGGSGGGTGSGGEEPTASITYACEDLNCAFDGTSSTDPNGQITDFSWSLGDGSTANEGSFEHEFEESGDYSVTLTVEDNERNTADTTQTVTVIIANEEPTANFSSSCVGTQCEFNGASSSDPDGEVAYWQWTLGDGNSGNGQSISHTFEETGFYTVTLTVEDDKGATDSKNRTVGVTKSNELPQADFSFNCNESQCSFDGGSSSDSDGSIDSWNWSFGDGRNASGSQVEHEYTAGGTFTVTVEVSDNDGGSSISSQQVTVVVPSENQKPVANFNFNCSELNCDFDASASTDPDGSVTTWSWNFGDGSSASGMQVSHTFNGGGNFTVSLTVEDEMGAKDSRTHSVSISGPDTNAAPEAEFSYDCDALKCRFDATSSHDSDGSVVNYKWSLGDGNSAANSSIYYQFANSGRFRVSLTVEDDKGRTDTQSSTVEVEKSQSRISLSGFGSSSNGRTMATLRWSGAETQTIQLFRDDQLIASTANDGKHIDLGINENHKTAAYRLCQSSSSVCSDTVVLQFGPAMGQ
jgi:serine protease